MTIIIILKLNLGVNPSHWSQEFTCVHIFFKKEPVQPHLIIKKKSMSFLHAFYHELTESQVDMEF
jgi:hypothetical protein